MGHPFDTATGTILLGFALTGVLFQLVRWLAA
jgi:hypothetical protein